ARESVAGSAGFDLGPRTTGSPLDTILLYPVVRPAWIIPIPHGRPQRDGLAVEKQMPVGRGQGGDNLIATPATAQMHHRCKNHGHVENAVLGFVGKALNELRFKPDGSIHHMSSLSSLLPSTT